MHTIASHVLKFLHTIDRPFRNHYDPHGSPVLGPAGPLIAKVGIDQVVNMPSSATVDVGA